MKQVEKFETDMQKRTRVKRLLLVFDQFFNVLLWNGSQDETVSSHIYRRIESGQATWFDRLLCQFLRKLEAKHCFKSLGE
jgi:hypothetical protein